MASPDYSNKLPDKVGEIPPLILPLVEENNVQANDQFDSDIDDQTLLACLENPPELQSLLPSLQIILKEIGLLRKKLNNLHQLKNKPQTLLIKNFNYLQLHTGVTLFEDQLNNLFFAAGVPVYWKIGTQWLENSSTELNSRKNDTVSVTMINYFVKERAKQLLTNYFTKNYGNIIYVE